MWELAGSFLGVDSLTFTCSILVVECSDLKVSSNTWVLVELPFNFASICLFVKLSFDSHDFWSVSSSSAVLGSKEDSCSFLCENFTWCAVQISRHLFKKLINSPC